MIYIIEGARCNGTAEAMATVKVTKIHRDRSLREELRRRYPGYQAKQLKFIIGIRGTIVERRWRWNLTTLGIERRRQDKIIRKCMTASIKHMQRGTGGVELKTEDSRDVVIIYCVTYSRTHTRKRRGQQ